MDEMNGDESGFNFEPLSPMGKSQSIMKRELNQSPNKTGGQI